MFNTDVSSATLLRNGNKATVSAFNKLSSNGTFDTGDSVTLLLGKDGKIADVVSPTESKIEVVIAAEK